MEEDRQAESLWEALFPGKVVDFPQRILTMRARC